MNLLALSKFVPAVGLVGLAVYHLSIGDLAGAGTAALAAATAFGLVPAKPAVNASK
jgi:hypothetical protein